MRNKRAKTASAAMLAARAVCAAHAQLAGLPQVEQLVSAFLGPAASWTLDKAVKRGHLRLAWLLARALAQDAALSALEKLSRAQRGAHEAACAGDVELLAFLTETFGCYLEGLCMYEPATYGRAEVLKWWLRQLQPLSREDARRLLPKAVIGAAAMNGDVALLLWMLDARGREGFPLEVVSHAAGRGHLAAVQWLDALAVPAAAVAAAGEDQGPGKASSAEPSAVVVARRTALKLAVCGGHLPVVQWICAHRPRWRDSRLNLVGMAAKNGHLAVVRCLLEYLPDASPSPYAMDAAAAGGHLDVVQFLCARADMTCSAQAMDDAAGNGHLEVVQFLHARAHAGCSASAMDAAAANGHLDVVRWLHEHRAEGCTPSAMDRAAAGGHLEIVKFLHERRSEGCTASAMDRAAGLNRAEVVAWLHAHRSEGCSGAAMTGAASNGHLTMVKWLHAHRPECADVPMAIDAAAMNGHVEVVQFLHALGAGRCLQHTMDMTARHGHLAVLRWMHAHRSEHWSARAMDEAAESGHWAVVKWLHAHRSEGCTAKTAVSVVRLGDLSMLAWLWTNRPECFTAQLGLVAVKSKRLEVVQWLVENVPCVSKDVEAMHALAASRSLRYMARWLGAIRGQPQPGEEAAP